MVKVKENNINNVDCRRRGVLFCQDVNGKWYYVHKTRKQLIQIEIGCMYDNRFYLDNICRTANLCIYRKENCQAMQNFKSKNNIAKFKWYSLNNLLNYSFDF